MRGLLFALLLAGFGFGAWTFYQAKLAESQERPLEKEWVDDAPVTIAKPLDTGSSVPKHLEWKLDPRWIAAEEEGAALMQQLLELYRWQEEEGGDPLRFRREKEEIGAGITPILEGLTALKAELAHHPGAAGNVEERIRELSTAMSGVLR